MTAQEYKELIAAIEAKRLDAEFQTRLRKILTAERALLERLART